MSVCAPHAYLVLQETRRGPKSSSGAINNCEVLSRSSQLLLTEPFSCPTSTFSTSQLWNSFKRLSQHPTKAFPAQLWLNKLLLFFIYFYLKEFVSLSQKLATLPTAKFIVTLMAENSLGIPNGIKGGKKVLSTNPKPRMTWRDITCHFFLFSSSAADGFQEDQTQFDFRKPFTPILAP